MDAVHAAVPLQPLGLGFGQDPIPQLGVHHTVQRTIDPTDAFAPEATTGTKLGPVRRLRLLLRPDRGDLWTILAFAVATGVLLLATPISSEIEWSQFRGNTGQGLSKQRGLPLDQFRPAKIGETRLLP